MRSLPILTLICVLVMQSLTPLRAIAQTTEAASQKVAVYTFLTGFRRYEPGSWGAVGLRINNLQSREAQKTVALYENQTSRMQYGRRMWVPAKASRICWLPFRVLDEIPPDRDSLDLYLLNFDSDHSQEILTRRNHDRMVSHSLLPIDRSQVKTAMILNKQLRNVDRADRVLNEEVYELVLASKQAATGSRVTIDLVSDFFPRPTLAYDGMDQLILCSNRIKEDSAGLIALRHWVQQGGRLWIVLDGISQETLTALLGDGICCDIVNRTELAEFTIEDHSQPIIGLQREIWRSDRPVSFVEVLTDHVDVQCWVNGWPAAFWKTLGRGEVLITTLGPRGWVHEFHPFADELPDQQPAVGATQALRSVASRFYRPRETDAIDWSGLRPLLLEQIGYRVPSRRIAIWVLMSSSLGLLLTSVLLFWNDRQAHLAWLAPLICLTAAGIMFTLGGISARKVPPSVAFLQCVRITPETHSADCRSLLAFYSDRTTALALKSDRDVLAWPDMSDLDGIVKRVTWDDQGQSAWNNIPLKPGTVRFVETQSPLAWNHPVRARGSFGPQGFQGRLEGEFLNALSDALIVNSTAPHSSIAISPSGELSGDKGSVLMPGQYLRSAMLSDEQRRRLEVYRHVLAEDGDFRSSPHPTLLAWRSPLSLDVDLPEGFQGKGSALVAIPIQLEPVPPGRQFVLPATFLRIENVLHNRGISMAFNPRSGRWGEDLAFPTLTRLRFVLPRQVQPCRLTRATVSFKAEIPSRTLSVSGIASGQPRVLFEKSNVTGTVQFEIEASEMLQLDEQGGLLLQIEVSDVDRADRKAGAAAVHQQETWQMEYLQVDLEGESISGTLDDASSHDDTSSKLETATEPAGAPQ